MLDHQRYAALDLASRLGVKPLYLVSNTDQFQSLSSLERRFVYDIQNDGVIAFTAPVADLLFRRYLRYDWHGRGRCIVFRKSPLNMTTEQFLGVTLHEMGHYVADSNRPERDDQDHDRAIKTFWSSMNSRSDHHDRRWFHATIHLWHRACRLGHEIPLNNVLDIDRCGHGRNDLAEALDNATRFDHQPIESVLPGSVSKKLKPHRKRRATKAKVSLDDRLEPASAASTAKAKR